MSTRRSISCCCGSVVHLHLLLPMDEEVEGSCVFALSILVEEEAGRGANIEDWFAVEEEAPKLLLSLSVQEEKNLLELASKGRIGRKSPVG